MSSVPFGSPPANHLFSLAHAAECLAKAAVSLSEAAEAMSIAAQALSSKCCVPLPLSNRSVGPATGVSGNDEGDVKSPLMDEAVQTLDRCLGLRSADLASADQLRSGPDSACLSSAIPTEKIEPDGSYRMLVDNEADVLLFVCALIGIHQKVICYMNCSIPAFPLYQKLINDVTETPVHIMTEITAAELERVESDFLEDQGGTLLLPETVCPDMKLIEADSWVIHIGWPADKHQYQAQKEAHQAGNNILIAYSTDEDRYPVGSVVMSQTQPWPGNDLSFGISVDVLRPLFDERLAAIPPRFKAAVYCDWITCHGPKGHRYVRSWTASDLAHRANEYLLEVLRYRDPNSRVMDSESATESTLPEVSAGFVTDNGLESAVAEGVLRIEPGSSLNHISSLSRHDSAPSSPMPLEETEPTGGSNYPSSVAVSDHPPSHDPDAEGSPTHHLAEPLRSPTPAPSHPEQNAPAEGPAPPVKFRRRLGHTYFALEEEFDAIPLICFLAEEYGKLVCFTDNQGALPCYKELFSGVSRHFVIAPATMNDEQANEDAAVQFVEHTSSAIFLLPFGLKKLPSALGTHQIGHCVYWGFTVPWQLAKRHRSQIACSSTSLIMTAAQAEGLPKRSVDIEAHPSSDILFDLSSQSPLSPMRDATKSFLASNKRVVNSLHTARMYFFYTVARAGVSAEEAAGRVNRYDARVLLHGNQEDGSHNFLPIAGRLVTPVRTVEKSKLQSAVDAGLLVVGK